MAGVVITVSVSGGSGLGGTDLGLTDENGNELELQARHRQGACMPCQLNDNPYNIPVYECTGNVARLDPDDPKALAIGNLCNCTVVLAEKGHQHDPVEDP